MERGKEKSQTNNNHERGRNEQQESNTTDMENEFRRKARKNPPSPICLFPTFNQSKHKLKIRAYKKKRMHRSCKKCTYNRNGRKMEKQHQSQLYETRKEGILHCALMQHIFPEYGTKKSYPSKDLRENVRHKKREETEQIHWQKKKASRQTSKTIKTTKTNALLRMFGKSNHMRHKTVVKRIVIVNTHAFKTLT